MALIWLKTNNFTSNVNWAKRFCCTYKLSTKPSNRSLIQTANEHSSNPPKTKTASSKSIVTTSCCKVNQVFRGRVNFSAAKRNQPDDLVYLTVTSSTLTVLNNCPNQSMTIRDFQTSNFPGWTPPEKVSPVAQVQSVIPTKCGWDRW